MPLTSQNGCGNHQAVLPVSSSSPNNIASNLDLMPLFSGNFSYGPVILGRGGGLSASGCASNSSSRIFSSSTVLSSPCADALPFLGRWPIMFLIASMSFLTINSPFLVPHSLVTDSRKVSSSRLLSVPPLARFSSNRLAAISICSAIVNAATNLFRSARTAISYMLPGWISASLINRRRHVSQKLVPCPFSASWGISCRPFLTMRVGMGKMGSVIYYFRALRPCGPTRVLTNVRTDGQERQNRSRQE